MRAFMPKAGVRYVDMTPTVILGMMLVVAGRYIASGLNNNELSFSPASASRCSSVCAC